MHKRKKIQPSLLKWNYATENLSVKPAIWTGNLLRPSRRKFMNKRRDGLQESVRILLKKAVLLQQKQVLFPKGQELQANWSKRPCWKPGRSPALSERSDLFLSCAICVWRSSVWSRSKNIWRNTALWTEKSWNVTFVTKYWCVETELSASIPIWGEKLQFLGRAIWVVIVVVADANPPQHPLPTSSGLDIDNWPCFLSFCLLLFIYFYFIFWNNELETKVLGL